MLACHKSSVCQELTGARILGGYRKVEDRDSELQKLNPLMRLAVLRQKQIKWVAS
jgi:hypothetical protein